MARRVYYDTCARNRPFDDQGQARIRIEAEAVEHLLRAVGDGALVWVSSDIVLFEVRECPAASAGHLQELRNTVGPSHENQRCQEHVEEPLRFKAHRVEHPKVSETRQHESERKGQDEIDEGVSPFSRGAGGRVDQRRRIRTDTAPPLEQGQKEQDTVRKAFDGKRPDHDDGEQSHPVHFHDCSLLSFGAAHEGSRPTSRAHRAASHHTNVAPTVRPLRTAETEMVSRTPWVLAGGIPKDTVPGASVRSLLLS